MKRPTKLALFALPLLVLSAALLAAKWKADNPTPTKRDFAIRKRFLETKDVVLFLDNQPVEGPDGQDYHLSLQDKQQIADHLWSTSLPSGVPSRFTTRAIFAFTELIVLDFARDDYYQPDNLESHSVKLHPATSRYLRWWIEQHPTVERKIALK